MQKMAKVAITLLSSTVGGWLGSALDHNNWFGVWSIVLGIVGFLGGIWLARWVDDYIES